jgi:hypothetical protein
MRRAPFIARHTRLAFPANGHDGHYLGLNLRRRELRNRIEQAAQR